MTRKLSFLFFFFVSSVASNPRLGASSTTVAPSTSTVSSSTMVNHDLSKLVPGNVAVYPGVILSKTNGTVKPLARAPMPPRLNPNSSLPLRPPTQTHPIPSASFPPKQPDSPQKTGFLGDIYHPSPPQQHHDNHGLPAYTRRPPFNTKQSNPSQFNFKHPYHPDILQSSTPSPSWWKPHSTSYPYDIPYKKRPDQGHKNWKGMTFHLSRSTTN